MRKFETSLTIAAAAAYLLVGGAGPAPAAEPLGSGFTFQGQLKQAGVPFDGTADFDFTLWDAETLGDQIGAAVALPGVTVTDGLFTVELDFGAAAFNGDERWLDVTVNGTPLSPRQKLTAAPYALQTRGLVVDDNGNVTLAPSNGNSASSAYAAAVGGGAYNAATGAFSTIGGGEDSSAAQASSTIGGGAGNRIGASGLGGTIAGGVSNTINGNGIGQTIGGGEGNTADGDSATVPGGSNNAASGFTSFAAGRRAKANHNGAFVWADSTNADFASTGTNQFLIRAAGGVGINKNDPATALDVAGTVTASAFVGDGSELTNVPMIWSETGPDIFYDTGDVGIGTAEPATPLHVDGGSEAMPLSGGYLVVGDPDGLNVVFDDDEILARNNGAAADLHINPDGGDVLVAEGGGNLIVDTDTLFVDGAGGKVGIGTIEPQEALEVVGHMLMSNPTSDAWHELGFFVGDPTHLDDRRSAIRSRLTRVWGNNPQSQWISFDVSDATNGGQIEVMRLSGNGNVGIGTTLAGSRLTVDGDADFTGNVGIGTAAPQTPLDVNGTIRSRTGGIEFPDGSVQTTAAPASLASTQRYQVATGDFVTGSTSDFVRVKITSGANHGGSYLPSGSSSIVAPVHLPHGAEVTKVTFHGYDEVVATNVKMRLIRSGFHGTGRWIMASVTSSTSSGDFTLVDTTISFPTIDLDTLEYFVQVEVDGGNWHSEGLLAANAIVIEYALP